jgi:adenylosuccinate synthase
MARTIVLLSGEIAAGKTTLCDALNNRFSFHVFKTRELIQTRVEVSLERLALQKAGEALDRKTQGAWVADALGRKVGDLPQDRDIVVDSVRIKKQIDAVRKGFGPRVVHVHLTAIDQFLRNGITLGRNRLALENSRPTRQREKIRPNGESEA